MRRKVTEASKLLPTGGHGAHSMEGGAETGCLLRQGGLGVPMVVETNDRTSQNGGIWGQGILKNNLTPFSLGKIQS